MDFHRVWLSKFRKSRQGAIHQNQKEKEIKKNNLTYINKYELKILRWYVKKLIKIHIWWVTQVDLFGILYYSRGSVRKNKWAIFKMHTCIPSQIQCVRVRVCVFVHECILKTLKEKINLEDASHFLYKTIPLTIPRNFLYAKVYEINALCNKQRNWKIQRSRSS